MKTKLKILIGALSITSFVMCSKEDITIAPEQDNLQSVEFGISRQTDISTQSRASITANGDMRVMQWSQGDKLSAWVEGNATSHHLDMSEFIDPNGQYATFAGELPVSGNVRMIYPYTPLAITDATSSYSIDISSQKVDLASAGAAYVDHASKLYMISNSVELASYDPATELSLTHLNTTLDLKFSIKTIAAGYEIFLSRVVVSGGKIYPKGEVNFADASVVPSTGDIAINIENSPSIVAGELYTLPISLFPFSIDAGDAITLTLYYDYVVSESGVVTHKKLATTKSYDTYIGEFKAGEYNTLTLALTNHSGNITDNSLLGLGTESDPYLISDAANFASFAADIRSGTNIDSYYKLTNDIDISTLSHSASVVGASGTAATTKHFAGVFDGDNFTISGVNLAFEATEATSALFPCSAGATIKNLNVVGDIIARGITGGIVGSASGTLPTTISNCTFAGSISNTTSNSAIVGGIIGRSSTDNGIAIIDGCTNYATINFESTTIAGSAGVAGVVGLIEAGVISSCANYGSINFGDTGVVSMGGVVGEIGHSTTTMAKILNCYNQGAITSTSAAVINLGGIVGETIMTEVNNCYTTGSISHVSTTTTNVRTDVGRSANNSTVANTYTATEVVANLADGSDILSRGDKIAQANMELADFVSTLNNVASEIDGAYNWVLVEGSAPTLQYGVAPQLGGVEIGSWVEYASPNFGGGLGSEASPYRVTSAYELAYLAVRVAAGDSMAGIYIELCCNIDLSAHLWTPITGFAGVFDYNGYAISSGESIF